MSKNVLNIGIVGNGFVVEEFCDAARQHPKVKLSAIFMREEDKNEEFLKKTDIEKCYASFSDLLKDGEVNCLYIAIPNSLHYSRAKAALLADKHVIVEKPLVSNAKEARELLELAKQRNLFIFEAFSIIYMPNYDFVRYNIKKLGDICLIIGNYSQFSSKYNVFIRGNHVNVFDPNFSGGTLMDLNYYNVYTMVDLFGSPKTASYIARKYKNGIDFSGIVSMEYETFNGVCIGAKDCSGINSFQIQGTKGYICVNGGINGVKSVTLKLNGQEGVLLNAQTNENRMYYEIYAFMKMLETSNFDKCYNQMETSIKTLNVVENCLSQIGLEYNSPKDF